MIQSPREGPHDRSRRAFPPWLRSVFMRFDTKIAIVVRDDLATWQKLNVACFLSGGLVGDPELAGERYADASGQAYGRLVRQPVLVFSASADGLQRMLRRAESAADASLYTKSSSPPAMMPPTAPRSPVWRRRRSILSESVCIDRKITEPEGLALHS